MEGSGGESSDGDQGVVGRVCPTKGFGLLMVDSDEIPDCSFQFLNASVWAALDLSLVKSANHRSTWLSHEACVGVKCR